MRAEINFSIPDGYHSVLHKWETFVKKSQSLPQIQLYTFSFLKKNTLFHINNKLTKHNMYNYFLCFLNYGKSHIKTYY